VQAQENKMLCVVRSLYAYVLNWSLDRIVGRVMGVVGSQELTFPSPEFRKSEANWGLQKRKFNM